MKERLQDRHVAASASMTSPCPSPTDGDNLSSDVDPDDPDSPGNGLADAGRPFPGDSRAATEDNDLEDSILEEASSGLLDERTAFCDLLHQIIPATLVWIDVQVQIESGSRRRGDDRAAVHIDCCDHTTSPEGRSVAPNEP